MSQLDFWDWVDKEVEARGLNYYRMEMDAGASNAVLSRPARNRSNPTIGACEVIAHGFDMPLEQVFRRAGILDPLPPESVHDGEAMALFRKLAPALQHVVIDCMKSMQSLQCIELAPQELDEDRTYIAAAGHLVDTMPIPALRRIVGRLLDHIEREQEREREQTTHVVTP